MTSFNTGQTQILERWHQRFTAASANAELPDSDVIIDELGATRAVDTPFLNWRRSLQTSEPFPPATLPPVTLQENATPDVVLWTALTDPSIDPHTILHEQAMPEQRIDADRGALFAQASTVTIEVWTEQDLAALHALRWLAFVRNDAVLEERVLDAARWHIQTIQPDNATNHPWAAHVFAELGVRDNSPEADLHAQTLMHNCTVNLGKPDRFSAHVLADCADALAKVLHFA